MAVYVNGVPFFEIQQKTNEIDYNKTEMMEQFSTLRDFAIARPTPIIENDRSPIYDEFDYENIINRI